MKLPFLTTIPIVLSLFCAPSVRAQNAGLPQDKCTIAGTVIDAVSEQVLKSAEVRVRAIPSSFASGSQPASQAIPQPASTNTDASGHFSFENLSAGRYFLLASHDGYVNNNRGYAEQRGKLIVLAPGQPVNDLVVRLLPNGSISGRITDEMGKPLRRVFVQAMKFSYLRGRREIQEAALVPTNDAGEYRIPALTPGKYFIRAKPPTPSKAKPGNDKAYVPIYYPAANDQSHSVALVVRAGEDLAGIDINLVPVHTVHIRGQVKNARTLLPSREAEVTLLADQGE